MLQFGYYFIINSVITLLIVYGFNIIGQIANKKFFASRFKYVMPIGFAWYMVSFQLLSFLFIMKQTTFSLFLVFFIIFVFVWLAYILRNKRYVQWKLNLKKNIFCIIGIGFVTSIVVLCSYVYSDSWLYSAMITSTIENNLIYSHNGTLANVHLSIMHHRFESYYLWQATVAMLYQGNYLVGLITAYKIFDGFLIVLSFMELGNQFKFGQIKASLFAVTNFLMLTASGSFLNMSPFQTTEPPIQFFQISTGTALFHYFLIPFTIIYLIVENKLSIKQKNLYLIGLLLTFSNLTTTYYYTMPLFIIAFLTIKHVVYKQKDCQLVFAFMVVWLLIIQSFIGVKTENINYLIGFTIIYLVVTKIVMYIYRKIKVNSLRNATLWMLGGYILVGVILFNPMVYASHDFVVDKQSLRLYNIFTSFKNGSYLDIIFPLIFLIFTIAILITLFSRKEFKRYGLYIITYSFYFMNPFSILIFCKLGVEPVISRIFAFSFIGYFILLISFYFCRNIIVAGFLVVWGYFAFAEVIGKVSDQLDSKISQIEQIDSDIGGLANYNFDENSFVVFDNLDASNGVEVYYTGINKLVVLNPSLSWQPGIETCNQVKTLDQELGDYDHCYTIYKKSKAEDLKYDYESGNYLIYKNY